MLALTGQAISQSFTSDNLVVLQVGDGSAALNHRAHPVSLVERRPTDGTIVSSLQLTPLANGRYLTLSGIATSEGTVALSADGTYILVGGYDAPVGTNAVAFTESSSTRRVVARVGQDRSINKSTALTDAFSTGNFRAVASVDGTGFWLAGTPGDGPQATGGIRFAALGASTSTQVLASPFDTRLVSVQQGQLYGTSEGAAFRVGAGLPVGSGSSAFLIPGLPSSLSVGAMNLVSTNRMYVADDRPIGSGGGVQRWSLQGGVWQFDYILDLGLTTGIRRLAIRPSGGTFELYGLTTQATQNKLVKVLDNGSATAWTTLATAVPNTAWRGLSFAPYANNNGDIRVLPNSYTTVQGEELFGGLDSLWEVDGESVGLFNDIIGLRASVEVTGVAPNGTFNQLALSVTAGVERNGLAVTFYLYNYTTQRFQAIGGQAASPLVTQYQAAAPSPISSFVGPGRNLRGRVDWAPVNDEDPSQDGWLHSLDRVNWMLGM